MRSKQEYTPGVCVCTLSAAACQPDSHAPHHAAGRLSYALRNLIKPNTDVLCVQELVTPECVRAFKDWARSTRRVSIVDADVEKSPMASFGLAMAVSHRFRVQRVKHSHSAKCGYLLQATLVAKAKVARAKHELTVTVFTNRSLLSSKSLTAVLKNPAAPRSARRILQRNVVSTLRAASCCLQSSVLEHVGRHHLAGTGAHVLAGDVYCSRQEAESALGIRANSPHLTFASNGQSGKCILTNMMTLSSEIIDVSGTREACITTTSAQGQVLIPRALISAAHPRMTRILYGINGYGNGHLSRAQALIRRLRACPHIEFDCVISGVPAGKNIDKDIYGDYISAKGFTFDSSKSYVELLRRADMTTFKNDVLRVSRIAKNYDVVLSDFEPVTAWAATLIKKPCIGMSTQMRILQQSRGLSILNVACTFFTPGVIPLPICWSRSLENCIPSITLSELAHDDGKKQATRDRRFVLVYLPFESTDDICALLHNFPSFTFRCYHQDYDKAAQDGTFHKHVEWLPLSRSQFQHELQICDGLITGAGFCAVSEALFYNRRLLIKPQDGQPEQAYNAREASKFRNVTTMRTLSRATLSAWLRKLNTRSGQENGSNPFAYRVKLEPLVEYFITRNWSDTVALSERMWEEAGQCS